MCGIIAIAGQYLNKIRYDTIAMLGALKSRGPDSHGDVLFQNCWLGHTRLAIVDLAHGTQPMMDGDVAISFNGEIYNAQNLRNILTRSGFTFNTRSDTEVILKAYRKWGEMCPCYLDGMFAFAIWDNMNDKLFLARDRFGKKPLYYCFDGSTILMASEIKSLLSSGVQVGLLNLNAIDTFLRLKYIPPWTSVYQDIKQLPPSHSAVFKDGSIYLNRYWQLEYIPIDISYEEAKSEVKRLFCDAVKKRVQTSDVEVGTFLSGGVDSSLVTLIAAEQLPYPLKTFSVSYTDWDELQFSHHVNKKIEGDSFFIRIGGASPDELENILSYFDEPHADSSDFPQHLVSALATQNLKVVLSGDGADEFFLGYDRHKAPQYVETRHEGFEKIIRDSNDRFFDSICIFSQEQRKQLWRKNPVFNDRMFIPDAFKTRNLYEIYQAFDISSRLPGQVLTKVDRAGMMHGLEVRSPFLDTELAEFVFNLPNTYKIKEGIQKYILRDLLSDFMPKDFAFRKKQSFGAPIDIWLRRVDMKDYVYSRMGRSARIRFLFGDRIDDYLDEFYTGTHESVKSGARVWTLLCLEVWLAQSNIIL